MERKDSTKSQVSEHTIKVHLNLSCCVHADVNKRQITGGKNNSDKIEEGISPKWQTCDLEHELYRQIPKSEGKRDVSTADELYSHLLPFRRKTFSLLTFGWIVFFFVSFFYSIKEYCQRPSSATIFSTIVGHFQRRGYNYILKLRIFSVTNSFFKTGAFIISWCRKKYMYSDYYVRVQIQYQLVLEVHIKNYLV